MLSETEAARVPFVNKFCSCRISALCQPLRVTSGRVASNTRLSRGRAASNNRLSPGRVASNTRLSPERVASNTRSLSPGRVASNTRLLSPGRVASNTRLLSLGRVVSNTRLLSPGRVASNTRLLSHHTAEAPSCPGMPVIEGAKAHFEAFYLPISERVQRKSTQQSLRTTLGRYTVFCFKSRINKYVHQTETTPTKTNK